MREFRAGRNDAGQRMDKFVSKLCRGLPPSLMYKSFRKGRIKLNGKKAQGNQFISEGDLVSLYINDEFFEMPSSELDLSRVSSEVDIIYEDENILIADKPQGLIVHSDESEGVNTLITRIQAYLMNKGEYKIEEEATFAPALCNRIDRNTSGLVLAAKNSSALRDMNYIIKHRLIKKIYRCACFGIFEEKSGRIEAFLERDREKGRVYIHESPIRGAREIVTAYNVIREREGLSLLEVELVTGRTHQIRAQLAYMGHPIIGDGKYGNNEINKKYSLCRQELNAYKVVFSGDFPGNSLSYLTGREFVSLRKLKIF